MRTCPLRCGILPVRPHTLPVSTFVLMVMLTSRQPAFGDDFQATYDRAILSFNAQRFDEALALFERAYKLSPKLRLLVNQGEALLELGRLPEALARCEEYLQRATPDSPYHPAAQSCVRRARGGRDEPPGKPEPEAARRAELAFAQQHYGEARRAWRLAYEEQPKAIYLYHCGEASQLLLEWQQAIDDYQGYLVIAGTSLQPEHAAEVRQRIVGLQQVVTRQATPTPDSPPTRPRRLERLTEVRRNEGTLAAGLTMWLSAYLPALGLGSWYGATASSRPETFYVLAAPVAGPFISAALFAANNRSSQQTTLQWSLPWALADGGAQLAGLVMTIVGSRRRAVPVHLAGALHLAPLWTPLGVGLAAQGRF